MAMDPAAARDAAAGDAVVVATDVVARDAVAMDAGVELEAQTLGLPVEGSALGS